MIFAIMRSANTNKGDDGMYDTTIAAKLLSQLESFLGRISPHFHKPVARFIGDMIYGIMAEKDIKLSSIVRALKENITPKKVEDRLSRMLHREVVKFDHHGRERCVTIEFGVVPVRLPDIPDRLLHMVVLEDMRLFKYGKIKAMTYPPNEVSIVKQCR